MTALLEKARERVAALAEMKASVRDMIMVMCESVGVNSDLAVLIDRDGIEERLSDLAEMPVYSFEGQEAFDKSLYDIPTDGEKWLSEIALPYWRFICQIEAIEDERYRRLSLAKAA
jgi:hypothetical protein